MDMFRENVIRLSRSVCRRSGLFGDERGLSLNRLLVSGKVRISHLDNVYIYYAFMYADKEFTLLLLKRTSN